MQSFYEAVARYEGMREVARSFALASFRTRIEQGAPPLAHLAGRSLDLGPVDATALQMSWHPWVFPWEALSCQFRPYISRFEVAIWVDGAVEALAYGRPSYGPSHLNLHFIERRMDATNALHGCAALVMTDAADAYAKVLGKEKLRIKDPAASAMPTYLRLGFEHDGRTAGIPYMARVVKP